MIIYNRLPPGVVFIVFVLFDDMASPHDIRAEAGIEPG